MKTNLLNDYYLDIEEKIPNEYIDFCKEISLKYSKSTVILSEELTSFRNFFFKNAPEDFSEHPIFKYLADLLKYTNKHGNYKHVFERSHVTKITGSLIPHADFRTCVLTIPVSDVIYPIHWYDDEVSKNMVETYEYKEMALINTHAAHGCPENDRERLLFQIGGFGKDEPFSVVRDAIIKRLKEKN